MADAINPYEAPADCSAVDSQNERLSFRATSWKYTLLGGRIMLFVGGLICVLLWGAYATGVGYNRIHFGISPAEQLRNMDASLVELFFAPLLVPLIMTPLGAATGFMVGVPAHYVHCRWKTRKP